MPAPNFVLYLVGMVPVGNSYNFPNSMNWLWPLVILDLILKGFALWRAARDNRSYWFVALLVLNTAGILPAIYLLFFSKKDKKH